MPKSKVNKNRKQKVNDFKQKTRKRMSEQTQTPRQLRSFPIWKSQDKIEMTGLEWEKIYNTMNIFREAIIACESVMQRNAASGVITTKFIDENDQEVSPEEVEKYTKELQAYFAKQAAANAEIAEPQGEAPSAILTETGEPATKASKGKKTEMKAV